MAPTTQQPGSQDGSQLPARANRGSSPRSWQLVLQRSVTAARCDLNRDPDRRSSTWSPQRELRRDRLRRDRRRELFSISNFHTRRGRCAQSTSRRRVGSVRARSTLLLPRPPARMRLLPSSSRPSRTPTGRSPRMLQVGMPSRPCLVRTPTTRAAASKPNTLAVTASDATSATRAMRLSLSIAHVRAYPCFRVRLPARDGLNVVPGRARGRSIGTDKVRAQAQASNPGRLIS